MHEQATAASADPDPGLEFGISEAAGLVGVSPATQRAWERDGLIRPARTLAGYRRFSVEDVERLRRVRSLRDIQGFNTPAIRLALGEGETNGSPSSTRRRAPDESQRLRALRLRDGLSLRQAAVRTGLSASFISLIERGLANPSIAVLQKLTASYGTSIAELMSGPRRSSEKPTPGA